MEEVKPIPIDWEFLIDKIIDEKCLLVLGPEAFTTIEKQNFHEELIKTLDVKNNIYIKRYYEDDGFYLFDNLSNRTRLCYQIQRYYNSNPAINNLKLLSDIPFHIYLSVTPDKLLSKKFDELSFNHQFGYYKKNKEPQEIKNPSKSNPLIYNLFGCIENEESLILSHDDLYDFFKSIFARKSMPSILKDELKNINNVIFLGIPFSKWYLQLLLRELEIHNHQYSFTRYAASQTISASISTFCIDQFRIQFVDKNIDEFVKELHNKCSEKNLLRKTGINKLNYKNLIYESFTSGEFQFVFDNLKINLTNAESIKELNLQIARYNRFLKKSNAGMLEYREKKIEEAEISESLLNLINTI